MNETVTASWYERLPKVELHLHLEGAIPYDALWQLVQKYGGDTGVPSAASLRSRFEYRDFPHFIETWVWKNQFIREYEDFTFIAQAVARDLARQNIRYVEVFFSPPDFLARGLDTQSITAAVRAGLDRVQEIQVKLVADLVRDFGPQRAETTLDQINEVRELGVVGIGIGGSEQDYPPELFEHVFARARELGFHTSAHAGEAAGAVSVWEAIRTLRAERIGHGTRAQEDEKLMDYLAEHRIPLEMCPLSNVRTGVVSSYASHPVRRFFDRGILLSINTDDPRMFGNSLAEEYQILTEQKGFTPTEIRTLILQAIEMSWMSEQQKQAMVSPPDRGSPSSPPPRARTCPSTMARWNARPFHRRGAACCALTNCRRYHRRLLVDRDHPMRMAWHYRSIHGDRRPYRTFGFPIQSAASLPTGGALDQSFPQLPQSLRFCAKHCTGHTTTNNGTQTLCLTLEH
jgi:adenosine deaminase